MYALLRPWLFRMDAERAHDLAMKTARLAQATNLRAVEALFGYEHPALQQTCWNLDFPNPLGLAAGFDKNAQLIPFWAALGFGFAEVGSVSAGPSEGNDPPRAFRLPDDHALVNRMGLPNEGARSVVDRLEHLRPARPVGINLAKTHDSDLVGEAALDDFRRSFRLLAPLADYVTLNVSCPNTRDGKTFEAPDALDRLLEAIFAEREPLGRRVPVLVKLSPPSTPDDIDEDTFEALVDVALTRGVEGFIATNTASVEAPMVRADLSTPEARLHAIGGGGLSGAPLEARATALVHRLYRQTEGHLPIIGVGGVHSAETAYRKIRAGASLVQLYTGLVYEGPGLVRRIKQGLVRLLARDGFASITEAVGADAERSTG